MANRTINNLTDTIGHQATIEMVRAWGGRRLYIPKTLPEGHPIAMTIGHTKARQVSEAFPGQHLELPAERNALIEVRNEAVYDAIIRQGRETRDVAEEYGITPRNARYIVTRMHRQDRRHTTEKRNEQCEAS